MQIRNWVLGPALAAFTLSAAQAQQSSDKATKKESKEMQTIVITREGNSDGKTLIEIDGDKVKVNGKDASDSKDVNVSVTKIKDADAFGDRMRVFNNIRGMNQNFQFDFNDDNLSLFSENSNRAMLGVITEEADKGARITSVTDGSAADKAGLKEGDVITRIGSKKIESSDDVAEAIHEHKPGDKVDITVLRNNKEQKITAELSKWKGVTINASGFGRRSARPAVPGMPPAPPQAPLAQMPGMPLLGTQDFYITADAPKLGITVQDREEGAGVVVTEVEKDGLGAKAGFREKDIITHINDKEVRNADMLRLQMSAMRLRRDEGSTSTVRILRDGKTQNIEVKYPKKIKTVDL